MPRRLSRRGGEIAARTTVTIPATGGNASGDADACPYCGETHDRKTVSGWWTELLHHVLYVLNKVLFRWSK